MRLHAIHSGDFKLDGGAMFGVVPKTLWERRLPDLLRLFLVLDVAAGVGKVTGAVDQALDADAGTAARAAAARPDLHGGAGPGIQP